MALPIDRVIEINLKALEVLKGYYAEMNQAFAKGDLMRVGELRASVEVVQKIVTLANKPYVKLLRSKIPDETLRILGLLDDEPNSLGDS